MTPLDEINAGEALREVHDEIDREIGEAVGCQDAWGDVIGDDRDVFTRYARALRDAGYEIVRARP